MGGRIVQLWIYRTAICRIVRILTAPILAGPNLLSPVQDSRLSSPLATAADHPGSARNYNGAAAVAPGEIVPPPRNTVTAFSLQAHTSK